MILDAQNLFCEAQTITSTGNATNDIDLGPIASANSQRDLGASTGLYFEVDCTTTAAGTSGTLTVALETDDNSSFSSPTVLYQTSAIAQTSLVAGTRLALVQIPSTVQKYLRVTFTVGGTLTAGAYSAYLTLDPQDNVSYAPGYSFPSGA